VVFTFWFHPMEGTAGHLLGFLYLFLLMGQMSLARTSWHTKIGWLTFLEVFVAFHGAVVAICAGNGMWPMFFFGFMMMFIVTQVFGIIKSKLAIAGIIVTTPRCVPPLQRRAGKRSSPEPRSAGRTFTRSRGFRSSSRVVFVLALVFAGVYAVIKRVKRTLIPLQFTLSIEEGDPHARIQILTHQLLCSRASSSAKTKSSTIITANLKADSLLCVGDRIVIKIHFHTNRPLEISPTCASLGEIFECRWRYGASGRRLQG
jgi:hypothetical protein